MAKATLNESEKAALIQAKEYYEAVTRFDISRVDNVQRDPELAKRLMRSYARHQGTRASAKPYLMISEAMKAKSSARILFIIT